MHAEDLMRRAHAHEPFFDDADGEVPSESTGSSRARRSQKATVAIRDTIASRKLHSKASTALFADGPSDLEEKVQAVKVAMRKQTEAFGRAMGRAFDDAYEGEEVELIEGEEGRQIRNFTQTAGFQALVLGTVLLNTITMGVELDHPGFEPVVYPLECFYTAIFTLEMGLKLWYMGLDYFRYGCNVLDCIICCLSIFDTWVLVVLDATETGLRDVSVLRLVRLSRVIRMLRLFAFFQELWLIIQGIVNSMKTIVWASILLLIVLYIFAIFFVNMVGKSNVGYYTAVPADHSTADWVEIFQEWHGDFDRYQYFGTVPRSMLTLFECAMEPLNLRPIFERQALMFVAYVVLVVICTFALMNVIVGVICDKIVEAGEESMAEYDIKCVKQSVADLMLALETFVMLDHDGVVTVDEIKDALALPEFSDVLKKKVMPVGGSAKELFDLVDVEGMGKPTINNMMTELLRVGMVHSHQRMFAYLKIGQHRMLRTLRQGQQKTLDRLDAINGCGAAPLDPE